jgi:hypothetical protein
MLICFSIFVFRDQAEQEKLPIGEPSLRGRTTSGRGSSGRPHDFCYTSREKPVSLGRPPEDSGAKGRQSFGSHNMILPILTVTLRQVVARGYHAQRDLC